MTTKHHTLFKLALAFGIVALLLMTLVLTLSPPQPVLADASDIAFQGFEDGDSWSYSTHPTTYNTEGNQIVNGNEDVWAIIEEFTGEIDDPADGTYFWGMQDLDNPNGGGNFAHTLVFSNVNVSGYSNVELSFMYNVYEFDNGDDLEYEVFFDDVGQGTVLLFEGSSNKSTTGWEEEIISVPQGTITVSLILSATQNGSSDYAGYDNIRLTSPPPSYAISKSAPGNVASGEVFTYTLSIENATGVTPTTTIITDVLPADVDFIIASHGGGLDAGNVISWTVSDFASGATLTRTFRVTATGTNDIKNVDYGVNGGSEWPTTTLGTTVTTQLIAGLHVTKVGPDLVAPNEAFTYTLTVDNQTGGTLTDLVISDTLPLSATYASSTPTGNWDDPAHTITWTAASLAHDTALTYTLVVTAPDETTTLTNDDYVAYATEWTTPTTGMPATTLIHNCNSIYGIQYVPDPGTDDASPCEGQDVTVTGIVYGVYDEGYFIAESAGPWHGVYVADANKPAIGDEVEISGEVYEHFGLTEIKSLSSYTVQSQGNETYASTLVTTTQIPYNDTATSEAYEGVFVETRDITVTATGSYNIWSFTDSSGGTAKADDWGLRRRSHRWG